MQSAISDISGRGGGGSVSFTVPFNNMKTQGHSQAFSKQEGGGGVSHSVKVRVLMPFMPSVVHRLFAYKGLQKQGSQPPQDPPGYTLKPSSINNIIVFRTLPSTILAELSGNRSFPLNRSHQWVCLAHFNPFCLLLFQWLVGCCCNYD